jgi:hypothetical protein
MAIGSFEPMYLRVFRVDTAALNRQWTELPYRKVPGWRNVLLEAERRTPVGARILIVTPHAPGQGGYRYAFERSHFILAGRELVPLRDPANEGPIRVDLRSVDYIACSGVCRPPDGFAPVWASQDGALLRRIR